MYFYKFSIGLTFPFEIDMLYPKGEYYEFLSATPTIILAFTFQFNLFPVYYSMKDRTPENIMKATFIGVYFCAAAYCIAGIFCYLTFGRLMSGSSILGSLLDELTIYNSNEKKNVILFVLLLIVALSFLLSSTMSIPIMYLSLKKNFLNTWIFCKKKFIYNKEKQEIIDKSNKIEEPLEHVQKLDENLLKNEEGTQVKNDDAYSVNQEKPQSIYSKRTKKSKRIIAKAIENKYLGNTEKNVIIIVLFVAIVAMTILIKDLSTV